jgi:hypothetical protein
MVTVDDLRDYVGASTSDEDFLQTCLATAMELVDGYITSASASVPANVLDNAYLQVGSEMYHRRFAPSGITQFASFDGSPLRMARDPLASTYPLLQRFVLGGV